jgi:hypothetical protein
MARTAIYYRVSTVDQSVDGQIAELRAYAEKRGFEVAGEYVDHCSGAARERPELARMMGDVRQRKADIVLVWAFDRFARSTSHLVSTLEELQGLGVDFISYKQQIDTSTAAGKLTNGLSDRFALTGPYLCLTKVSDNLLCGIPISGHDPPFARVPNPNFGNGNIPGGQVSQGCVSNPVCFFTRSFNSGFSFMDASSMVCGLSSIPAAAASLSAWSMLSLL